MAFSADSSLDVTHLLLGAFGVVSAAFSAVIGFLVKRAIGGIDKRQDSTEDLVESVKGELTAENQRNWSRHDAEHTRIHEENEAEHRRIRGDIASNSEDISRLLERTKDL